MPFSSWRGIASRPNCRRACKALGGCMSTEPRRLGKYELEKRLAHGGMGEVWKAHDTQLNRYIAIKLLRTEVQDNPEFATRFEQEARFIAALRHPNIVQIHDFSISQP